jgi:Sigma-70 factor, region 1.2
MSARPDQLDTSEGLGVLARQAARHPLLSQSEEIRLAKRIETSQSLKVEPSKVVALRSNFRSLRSRGRASWRE